MRGSHKPYPAVIQGNDKVALEQLDVHLAAPEQHQRVHGHHAAVPDEHAARLDLLVVHQVRALKVPGLGQGHSSLVRVTLPLLPLPYRPLLCLFYCCSEQLIFLQAHLQH